MRFFNTHIGRCATLLALGGGIALYSQGTQTASVTITVVDQAGAAVANARVRLTSPNMQGERTGVTNTSGIFVARLLPPGTYTIEVIRDGFQTARVTRPIGMDQHFQPRIVMQTVAGATVEVIASSLTALDPTDVKTASNYDADRVDALPMGRTPDAMALMTPGVTAGVGGRTQVRGSMTSGNLYLVDGQNIMDNVYNNLQYRLNADSLEETQVITGAISAEYGNVDGGVINTITKSGGNEFSGSLRVNLENEAWNAMKPYEPREDRVSSVSQQWNFNVGGYIIKDRLWFYFSYTGNTASYTSQIDPGAAPYKGAVDWAHYVATEEIRRVDLPGANIGRGGTYQDDTHDYRRQFKLTYLINQDHTIVGTYNNTANGNTGRDYGAGDVLAIMPQDNIFKFWNLSWRATWSPQFTTELRYGGRDVTYIAGAKDATEPQINNDNSVWDDGEEPYLYYRTGLWRYGKKWGDNRSNNTANFKGSFFTEWNGTHEIDFGVDYYKGTIKSTNQYAAYEDQSGRNWGGLIFNVAGLRYDTVAGSPTYGQPLVIPSDVWRCLPSFAAANKTEIGLYVNDKWKVNNNLTLLIGVRWDRYAADSDDITGNIASASGFSPRLGLTYDLFGDQKWVFKASYCRYNGAVLENITSAVSGAGNPTWEEYWYHGPGANPTGANYLPPGIGPNTDPLHANAWQPLSVATNLIHYENKYISYYNDPTKTIGVDPNLKPPYADEIQLSAYYSFETKNWGKGGASLTFVKKDWGNLMDYRVGYNGDYNYEDFGIDYDDGAYLQYWSNEPDAKREYRGLELAADYQYGNLNITGSVTLSSLKGNYEGEGSSTPGSGEGIHYLDNVKNSDGSLTPYYDYNMRAPYGYLTGHRRLVMRWAADYTHENLLGTTTYGYIYRYTTGGHYSHTRQAYAWAFDGEYGDNYWDDQYAFWQMYQIWNQYENNKRRPDSFNSTSYHDIAITHEFNLFKVGNIKVRAFGKLLINNVFNHMQQYSWSVRYRAAPGGEELDAPFVKHAEFGSFDHPDYWGAARSISISAGVRF